MNLSFSVVHHAAFDSMNFCVGIAQRLAEDFGLDPSTAYELAKRWIEDDFRQFCDDPTDADELDLYWGELMHRGGPRFYACRVLVSRYADVPALAALRQAVVAHYEEWQHDTWPAGYPPAWLFPVRPRA